MSSAETHSPSHSSPARGRTAVQDLLAEADVRLDGSRPWDVQVHSDALYERVLREGSLGVGESYMDGWWDAPALDQFFEHILRANLGEKLRRNFGFWLAVLQSRFFNLQSYTRAPIVARQHYDLGNDLFRSMLDKRMTYSCGYWKDAQTLDEAQEAKLDLVCRKIGLKRGQHVLDIGCGWGSFAGFAAEKYGAHVTGVTISKEQAAYARERYRNLPIEIRLQDYRELSEAFDHVISIGMFEHVGSKNYRTYMETVSRCLRPGGLFLLHTIGANRPCGMTDPWIGRYIFPNGVLPAASQITEASEKTFIVEDWHNFGPDYDRTLMAWHENFKRAWTALSDRYDERFRRMWTYYLMSCAGYFRCRGAQLWQIVLSKPGTVQSYQSIR